MSASPVCVPLELTCSRQWLAWLQADAFSIAFTTYQTNRLFLIGVKSDGTLSTFERLFDRAMGLYTTPERLYLSSRYQLWQLDNALAPGQLHQEYDRVYVPRIGYTVGDLDVHDLALDRTGRVVFVNTLYSCLATPSDRYSFTPLWQPPFISKLTAEDRCHLNGLAMVDGQPTYVTAVSCSDVAAGWRQRRRDGGVVVHVPTGEIVLSGLSMPHSPRFYQGKLWLLNSGSGEFGYADLNQGSFEPVAFCPGYLRGLAFHGNYAIVGLSKPRHNKTFSGLVLNENLAAKDVNARCGLMVIDLNTGDIAHWLDLEGVVEELYDVQVLPGVRQPMALGFKTDEICHFVTFEPGSGAERGSGGPNPELAREQFQLGRQYQKLGDRAAAVSCFQKAVSLQPDFVAAYNNLGNLLQAQGQVKAALAAYEQALKLNPNLATAHCNLANLWQMQGDRDRALAGYQQAITLQPDFFQAHHNLGKLWATQGKFSQAKVAYQEALRLAPQAAEVHLELGHLERQQGRMKEAIASYRAAIRCQPDSAEAYNSLGAALQRWGEVKISETCYRRAIALQPNYAAAHFNLGLLLEPLGRLEEAQSHYERSLELNPDATDASFHLNHLRLQLCDWDDYDARVEDLIRRTQAHLEQQSVGLSPLILMAFPVPPDLQKAVARHQAQTLQQAVAPLSAEITRVPAVASSARLRIGYLSPDFRYHAVGTLIHQMFQYHQRPEFEIFAYSLVPAEDAWTQSIRQGCDHFVDLSCQSPLAAAQRIQADGIHILIDLAGYTTNACTEIFALQPAPIQVQYLGYPGTMGADFIQYILADEWLIPPERATDYSEQVVYLPQGWVAAPMEIAEPFSRTEYGLPEAGMVFCCFNRAYKIDPQVFEVWMRILQQVPDSVLWLADGQVSVVAQRLRQRAADAGVAPERLIFAPNLPAAEYLAQYRLADLFLDTFTYNAGATAVGALWAGVPVLTRPGETYASRMGASLCAALGLTELICDSTATYEQRAIHLGTHHESRLALKQQLMTAQTTAPLFQPQRFVLQLEVALRQMWQVYCQKQDRRL